MFRKSSVIQKVLMPFEAFAVIHPDLPLWLRHKQRVEKNNVSMNILRENTRDPDGYDKIRIEQLTYSFDNRQDKMSIPVEVILEKEGGIKIGYNWHSYKKHIKDAGFQRGYTADIGASFTNETSDDPLPEGHVLIDNIKFSGSLVSAIQEHFQTKEDINKKPIAERFVYFMMIGSLMRSPSMDFADMKNVENLMLCLEDCGQHIAALITERKTTLEKTFFGECTPDGSTKTYFYFEPEVGAHLSRAVYGIAQKAVPGFVVPALEAPKPAAILSGTPALLSPPEPET